MTKNAKPRIVIERTYRANAKEIWELWTTKEGIESWWGPDGFSTKVLKLDLWPGGELRYAMTATAPTQIEFMKKAGMPLTTDAKIKYLEVVPETLLAYTHLADFIPGVEPYDVATRVEFHSSGKEVKMILSFDPMHEETWTRRATRGHESQLDKLAIIIKHLASRT